MGELGGREVRGVDVGVFELFETGVGNVEIKSDAFLLILQKARKGIRTLVFS
jgi:hypothetical protein